MNNEKTFSTIADVKPKLRYRNLRMEEIPEINEELKDIKEAKPTKEEPYLIQVSDEQFYSIYYDEEEKLILNWLAPIMILRED